MKIYHTKTQEDYDALMREFESIGYIWFSGRKPTKVKLWMVNRAGTYVICNSNVLTLSSISWVDLKYPEVPIVEYTAPKPRVERNSVKELVKEVSKDNKEMYHTIIQELEQTYLAKGVNSSDRS